MVWQGRLFALMEAGMPTEIDPRDLATIGETNLDGASSSMFSAHPHRVASRKATYNFGLEYGRKTRLHMYELPDVGRGASPRRDRARRPADAARLHRDRHAPRVLRVAGARRRAAHAARSSAASSSCSAGSPSSAPRSSACRSIGRTSRCGSRSTRSTSGTSRTRSRAAASWSSTTCAIPTFDSFYEIGAQLAGSTTPVRSEGTLHRATIDLDAQDAALRAVANRLRVPHAHPGRARPRASSHVRRVRRPLRRSARSTRRARSPRTSCRRISAPPSRCTPTGICCASATRTARSSRSTTRRGSPTDRSPHCGLPCAYVYGTFVLRK